MTRPAAAPALSGKSLTARVAELCAQVGLSEVARRSDTPVSSVHRYVGGARVPAEFCADVVKGLGVNPAWLLLGEGAPWLADVPQRTAKVAGGMLELVEAMNAVAHMRLGSLAGKENRKVLRELDDAMRRHEQLRGKLHQHVAPVAHELLEALRNALSRREMKRAAELHAALEQLMRFSDDGALRRRFESLGASLAYALGKRADAVAIQRRVFLALLADAAATTDQVLRQGHDLAAAMTGIGHTADAAAMLRATLAFTDARHERPPAWYIVNALLGLLESEFGDLQQGLPRVALAIAGLPPEHATLARMLRMSVGFVAYGFNVGALLGEGPYAAPCASGLIQYALWEERPESLAAVIKSARALGTDPWRNMHLNSEQAELVLELLQRRRKAAMPQPSPEAEARCRAMPGIGPFQAEVYAAQRQRLAGNRAECASACRAAQQAMVDAGPQVTFEVMALGQHYRNVKYALPDTELAAKARAFFEDMRRRGYACFTQA